MKTMKTIALLLVILMPPVLMAQLSKDEAAIKQVIENETNYFLQRDFEKWSNTWLHSPTIHWAVYSPNYHYEYSSWEELEKYIKEEFKRNPQPIETELNKTDYKFNITKNAALVRFTEAEGSGTRVLIKDGGKWKISQMTVTKLDEYKVKNNMRLLNWAQGSWQINTELSEINMPWVDSIEKQTCYFTKTPTGFKIKSVFTNNQGNGQWHMWEVKELNITPYNTLLPVFIKAGGDNWIQATMGKAFFKEQQLNIIYYQPENSERVVRKEVYSFDLNGTLTLEGKFIEENGKKENTYKYVFER
ncbi:hypothetical protein E9993_02120 [Labilibacter sediminis]|nr:hypothetical protein E9993_02120 [Labilibacter sediminis]